jgi:hypothetical protein
MLAIQPGTECDLLHLILELKMSGAIPLPPLFHMLLWFVQLHYYPTLPVEQVCQT